MSKTKRKLRRWELMFKLRQIRCAFKGHDWVQDCAYSGDWKHIGINRAMHCKSCGLLVVDYE